MLDKQVAHHFREHADKFDNTKKPLVLFISYNPDPFFLSRSISLFSGQSFDVIVFDNGSSNIDLIQSLVSSYQLIAARRNFFIAPVLNSFIFYAHIHRYKHLLFLDQDTYSYSYTPSHIARRINSISCAYAAINFNQFSCIGQRQNKYFLFPNSGTVYNLLLINQIGGIDLRFPLDGLDIELCSRLNMLKLETYCHTPSLFDHTTHQADSTAITIFGYQMHLRNYNLKRIQSITRSNALLFWLAISRKQYHLMVYLIKITIALLFGQILVRILEHKIHLSKESD